MTALSHTIITLPPLPSPVGVVGRRGAAGSLRSIQSGTLAASSSHGAVSATVSGSLVRSGAAGRGG